MIEINGKEYGFTMGRAALRMYARKKQISDLGNKEFVELLSNVSMDDADLISWCAIKAASKDFNMTFEEFQNYLTENPHVVDALDKLNEEQMPESEGKPTAEKA